jgi:phosphatidylglycerophosphate synthase
MMEKKDSKFITQLVILTVVVMVACLFAHNMLTVWWPAIVVFFAIVSAVMYFLSEKAKAKDMRKFASFYMAATVVKMVVYLAIIIVYIMNFKEDGKHFAITFLIIYLIYSVFETMKLAKKEKK